MADNFINCILKGIKDGNINKKKGDALIEKYNRRLQSFQANGNTREGAAQAAEQVINAEQILVAKRERNVRQAVLMQEQIKERFANTKGSTFAKYGRLLQAADFRGSQILRTTHKFLDKVAEKFEVNLMGTTRDHVTFRDGVRWAVGGDVTDPNAIAIGKAIRAAYDYQHARYTAAGGIMGKLENYYPQIHKKELIRAVDKDVWVKDTLKLVNHEEITDNLTGAPFNSKAELEKVLETVYDDIVSGGKKGSGKGDIDLRHSKSRFLIFNDADSFLKYNSKYGVGDEGLTGAFLSSIEGMSRDIATLEVLGPRPVATKNFLNDLLDEEGGSLVNTKKNLREGEFNVLTSRFEEGDTDHWIYKAVAGTQNVLRSALLGSASISALSDIAFAHATARLNGLSSTRILANHLATLAPGSNEAKVATRRLGLVSDVVAMQAMDDTRIAGASLGNGWTAQLARMTNKLSGLDRWTKSVKAAVSVEAITTVGELVSTRRGWAQLEPRFKDSISDMGIEKADWDFMLKHGDITEIGGNPMLIPTEFRAKAFSNPEDAARAIKVSDKIDDWIEMLRQTATNEATLNTRAITSGAAFAKGAGGAGTPSKLIGSTIGLFKTFPITAAVSNFSIIARNLERGRTNTAIEHMANTFILTTILGAGVIQLKNLSKGRTMQESNMKLWMSAALQGGGLGLFGDFLFGGGESRFGRNIFTEMGGPMAGLISDTVVGGTKAFSDLLNDKDGTFKRDMFRIFKRNGIPVIGSLWYTRLILERTVLDQLERLADPRFDNRSRLFERRMNEEKDQQFWWRPGRTTPRGF